MLEKIWPFGRSRFRKAVEEALEKAFQETGEALEPLSELSEHEDHYLLRVEVPGLGPENLEVRLEGDQLVIEGERSGKKSAPSTWRRSYTAASTGPTSCPRTPRRRAWKPASKGACWRSRSPGKSVLRSPPSGSR
jgi:hypothetical protein